MLVHPALLKLIGLNLRGRSRRLTRGLRTRKGILYTLVACGFFALSVGPAIVNTLFRVKTDPALIRSLVPMGMLVFCLAQLMSMKPGSGVAFLPAEIDFLFPGPFLRRDLLAYKIVGLALSSLGVSIFFSIYLVPLAPLWLAGFVGALLAILFLQLLYLCATLTAATIAESAFTRGRKLALFILGVLIAVAVGVALSRGMHGGLTSVLTRLRESWAATCLLTPFAVFGNTLGAETFAALLGWGAAAAGINLALVLLALRLDANFMETSIAASQKLYERQQRARRGAMWAPTGSSGVHWRIPQFPWLGGAGPIAWRQLMTAFRGARGLAIVLGIFCLYAGVPLAALKTPIPGAATTPAVLAFVSIFLIPQMVRFDFRGDLDRMETIKTLPIHATAIVIGELMTPIAIGTAVQLLVLGGVGTFQRALPPGTLLVIAFSLPFNLLVYGVENLVFLLYPYRLPVGGAFDLASMGRQMLIVFLKLIALAVVAGCAAAVGGLAYLVSRSGAAFVAGSWLATVLVAIGVVPLVSWAYARFDPSTDTPP
jgi:hypothetical protein